MSKAVRTLLALLFLASALAFAELPMAASRHVVVIVEENHSYSKVIGNSSMPYFNGLANVKLQHVSYNGGGPALIFDRDRLNSYSIMAT